MTENEHRTARQPELSDANYLALASFRRAVRRYLAFAEEGAKSAGLTSQQHQALLAIKAHTIRSPMTIGELAAELLLKHHSTVELVGRLEKAGLASKDNDLADRRKMRVALTLRGEAVLSVLSARNLAELRHIAPSFNWISSQLKKLAEDSR